MPSYSYPVIPSNQLLWKKDAETASMTKTEARVHVNNLFREELFNKAGEPPSASTISSFHGNHPVGRVDLCYGMTSPIKRIGTWYAKCGGTSDDCPKYIKYLHRAVPETTLFLDEDLRRFLFMREELKLLAQTKETIATAQKASIERSPLYRIAFSDVYPDLGNQVFTLDDSPPATPPAAASSSSQAGPSRKRARDDDSPQPASSSKHVQMSSATLSSTQKIPIFIVLWTQEHLDPSVFAVLTKDGNAFSLDNHRLELQANGLTADDDVQVYREGGWKRLRWSKKICALHVGQSVLLRLKGVEALATFDWMKELA